jgi:hypothetical protein
MTFRPLLLFCFLVVALPIAVGQEVVKSASSQDFDMSSFVKETQRTLNAPGYLGLVWWIPTEYWEISLERAGMSEEKAKQRYAALRKYTVVAVALGKMGIGNVNWLPETDIRDNLVLRDSAGNSYQSVQKISGDAAGLASILKPVFANMLGAMGQNTQLLFFPAVNKMSEPIVDPLKAGNFSLVLSKLVDGKDEVFEWKLPLTALSPPKYCPVGKERVEANWKYCPWHGVRLEESPSPPTPPTK